MSTEKKVFVAYKKFEECINSVIIVLFKTFIFFVFFLLTYIEMFKKKLSH